MQEQGQHLHQMPERMVNKYAWQSWCVLTELLALPTGLSTMLGEIPLLVITK